MRPTPCRSLSCQRITLHKNLFFSFVLNSVITIIWLTAVANNQELVQRNPVSQNAMLVVVVFKRGVCATLAPPSALATNKPKKGLPLTAVLLWAPYFKMAYYAMFTRWKTNPGCLLQNDFSILMLKKKKLLMNSGPADILMSHSG